jgi:hypothetical protein
MTARDSYLELTRRHRAQGLFTREGNSNHLPMALGALLGLGAPAHALQRFADQYATRLPSPTSVLPVAIATPPKARAAFAQPARYTDLLAFFNAEIERAGSAAVQSQWLDELLQAPASSAFHSLIRLAYGRRFDHPGEVASGLADLAAQRKVLPLPVGSALPMADALARLRATARLFGTPWRQPPISQRLAEVVAHDAFSRACAPLLLALGDTAAALDVLSDASIDEYLGSMSFTALHLVTACHALRAVLPALTDAAAALRAFWPAWAAALVVARSTSRQPAVSDEPGAAWPALVARTLGSDDDHVIKMVFTCQEEHARTGDPRYLRAASRLLAVGQA